MLDKIPLVPETPVPENIREISELSDEFHDAGVISREVILAIYQLTRDGGVINSVETGSGKSTLLLSAISKNHKCFTLDTSNNEDARSLSAVRNSPLFNPGNVEFILGPTQRTLPGYSFGQPLQLVFIDGPHGFPFPNLEYYFLYPHLEEGGLLILDDIHIPTIAMLNQFLTEDEMFEHLCTVQTTSFFKRTSAPVFDPYGDGWWLQNYNKKRFSALRAQYYSGYSFHIYDFLNRTFGKSFAERVRLIYRKLKYK